MRHHDSKRLPYSCKQLFDMVADIESYPAFLPGWSRVRILNAEKSLLDVEQQLQAGPIRLVFHSTAQLEDCQRILITSHDAPFGDMTIEWRFTPLEDDHCTLSVEIALALKGGLLRHPLSRLLAHQGNELLRLFENRARSLYPVA